MVNFRQLTIIKQFPMNLNKLNNTITLPKTSKNHLAYLNKSNIRRDNRDFSACKSYDQNVCSPVQKLHCFFCKLASNWIIQNINPFELFAFRKFFTLSVIFSMLESTTWSTPNDFKIWTFPAPLQFRNTIQTQVKSLQIVHARRGLIKEWIKTTELLYTRTST